MSMHKKIEILNEHLIKIEKYLPHYESTHTNVSQATVGWQLDHALKVLNSVLAILAKTDPKKYKNSFNFKRSVIFATGKFPRGKAKSPKQVLPPEIIKLEDLLAQLSEARKNVKTIISIDKHTFFIHHIFGTLNKNQTLRFLDIHTNHHLKIVDDILK